MDFSNSRRLGFAAELKACQFLESRGMVLLQRNYSCRQGEIDLIMRDQDDIVFVEVRMRHNTDYGTAVETVTRIKQKKLIKAALSYIARQRFNDVNYRFDIIGIHGDKGKDKMEWIRNAFTVDSWCTL